MSHEEFFKHCGGYLLQGVWPYGKRDLGIVEDLYQAFKSRLIAELRVTTPELLERAELIDTEDES